MAYDITERKSFENIIHWIGNFKQVSLITELSLHTACLVIFMGQKKSFIQ